MGRKKKSSKNSAIFSLESDPNEKITQEEYELRKQRAIQKARVLLSKEGYKLNDDLVATHVDEDNEAFKSNFCKNGWSTRTIKNIEGWGIVIKYRRYRTRQAHKVRGVEKPTEFQEIIPTRQEHPDDLKELVKELYKQGYTVPEIETSFKEQKGIVLSLATIRNWTSKVARDKKKKRLIIADFEKTLKKRS
jgi:myosin-crossreactive antigen